MHALAKQLNQTLQAESPYIYEMLSELAKKAYFPKEGIISQSAEASAKASKFNATIGIALENNKPMHLPVIQETLSSYDPKDLYPYAPPAGKPDLRAAWKEKLLKESPSLQGKVISQPIVTNALTHGLSLTADLFAEPGDPIIYPDKNWENYDLTFGLRRNVKHVSFPLYNRERKFNAEGLKDAVLAQKDHGKAIVILNFPNNPTGYTPGEEEANQIVDAILTGAQQGINIVAVTDDAYYGLFFENSIRESLFAKLSGLHERILPVKVDGATKEDYVWGFRVGFITFSANSAESIQALEQKAIGLIRASISSGPHPSQTFVLKALTSPNYEAQKTEKFDIMKRRANLVKGLLDSGKYDEAWSYYPFNSGYFMCLELKKVPAEKLRRHLLEKYGIGTIALGEFDLRIAFSCIEEQDLEELFDSIYQGALDLM